MKSRTLAQKAQQTPQERAQEVAMRNKKPEQRKAWQKKHQGVVQGYKEDFGQRVDLKQKERGYWAKTEEKMQEK